MILLSPSRSTDFEIKLSDMIGGGTNSQDREYNVIEKIIHSPVKLLCIFGKDENINFREILMQSDKVSLMEIPGSHKYDNNISLITNLILETANQ